MTVYADPGAVGDVVAGNGIEATWGNAIRDRAVHHFANAAARDAAITSPKEGMACWLADVDQFLIYNGVAWRKPWSSAWGSLDTKFVVADQGTFTAATDLTSLTSTLTVVANRIMVVTVSVDLSSSVSGDRAAVHLNIDGVDVKLWKVTCTSGAVTASGAYTRTGEAAGSHTYKLRASRQAGTGNITMKASLLDSAQFSIADIGPNGVAA